MTIRFHGSPAPTLGVELELGLVDAATGELVGAAGDVLERLSGGPFEAKVKHELFQCTVEVITDVCDTVADARADLDADGPLRPGACLPRSGSSGRGAP